MKKKLILSTMASLILFTTGCFKEKKLPAEKVISIYNSNLQETRKMYPSETMYVKVAGLAPNKYYRIEVLDPNLNLITKAETLSNSQGVIEKFPLWFEVGLRKRKDEHNQTVYYYEDTGKLQLRSFYIRVKSLDDDKTDLKQDFFVILGKPKKDDMPRGIVSSLVNDHGFKMENTFFETGSKNPDGSDSNYTKVYVKADNLPYYNDKEEDYKSVDIYVVPFIGTPYPEGYDLENNAIVVKKDVPIKVNGSTKQLDPTLVWDLNTYPTLVNPGQGNNAYSIIIDINKNGKLDIGKDMDGDGVYDKYIDAIDGQGSAGFVVLNTEANDLTYKILDENNNSLDSIPEHQSGQKIDLYLNLQNIPTSEKNATVYVIDKDTTDLEDGFILSGEDVRNGGEKNVSIIKPDDNITLPYIYTKLINTDDDDYSYNKDVTKVKPLDVVVDINKNGQYDKGIDYYLPNVVNILPVEVNVTTTNKNDENTTIFNETNSDSNTSVYVRFGNKKDSSVTCGDKKEVYVFKHRDWKKGDSLIGELFRKEIPTTNGCSTKIIDFDANSSENVLNYEIINPKDDNNKFDILIDNDGSYDYSDGDKLITISVKNTKANDLANVTFINIASGGVFTTYNYYYDPNLNAYDYRDVFDVYASNTQWSCCGGSGSTGEGRGIKAIWNPYIKNRGWWERKSTYVDEKGNEKQSPFYEGQYVDLYIVDATKFKLVKDAKLDDSVDVRGRKQTIPVQFSCRNGYWQQNIWSPKDEYWRDYRYKPMRPGKYYVIIDVNRDGKLTEGVDFVDAVNKAGVTKKDDYKIVGFSIVE